MRLTAVATREKERAVWVPADVPSSKERESTCDKGEVAQSRVHE